MFKRSLLSFLYLLLFTKSLAAIADDADKDSINKIEVDLISLYNPLGLSFAAKAYHRQIYHHDDSKLWDGLYYQWAAETNINPAFIRAGVYFEWMPIAVLQVRARYDKLYFSGSNGSLLPFSSKDQLFGDDELKARIGDEISGQGDRASLHVTLRAKFDNVIVRNVTNYSYYQFPGNSPYYLEREHELLMATNDHVVSNQLYLLFENNGTNGETSFLGPYHDYAHVRNSGLTSERLGLTWYKEYDKPYAGLKKPRWYIQSGIYLQEPNRKDEGYLLFGIGGDF